MVSLIWLTFALSFGLALSSYLGFLRKWPKVFYVSALSNCAILALYYAPGMFGYHYYFADLIKTVPLIMWLVYLCREDPAPDWTYRAMCWVLILQIVTGGWHILAGLQSPYYDQLSLFTSLMELTTIFFGGLNARFSSMGRRSNSACGSAVCSRWAKRNNQGGA